MRGAAAEAQDSPLHRGNDDHPDIRALALLTLTVPAAAAAPLAHGTLVFAAPQTPRLSGKTTVGALTPSPTPR